MRPFECTYNGQALELLDQLNISLIMSTYQAGKVILLSSDGRQMHQLVRDFPRPMGIALKGDMMALAGALSVTVLRTDPVLAKTYPEKPDTYDAFYYPVTMMRTDYVDIHDIAFTTQGLVGVNTAFSCLSRLDGLYSFHPIWWPSFIHELVPLDLCHLNGMAVDEASNIRYVTAFGETASKEGWREHKLTSGVLIDTITGEIVLNKLPMPHSPRIYQGKVFMLLSATEEFVQVDVSSRSYRVIAKVDGFIRGLSFIDHYAFIGVSKLRKSHTFSDLEIADKEIKAGVVIVDINTGETVGEIKYETSVDELYDVHLLKGLKRVNLINYQQSLRHRALITPFACSWVENAEHDRAARSKEDAQDEKKD